MRIIYIIDFDITGFSGRSKATREKINVIKNKIGESNFKIYVHKKNNFIIFEILKYLLFDLKVFSKIAFIPKNTIVIRRFLFLPFTTLILKIRKIKVITECHTDFREEINVLDKGLVQKSLLSLSVCFSDITFRTSSGIIYNHPFLKERFDHVFKIPSIYSYNGCNSKEFQPMDKLKCRNELELCVKDKIFLFLGSVSKWHGVDYLINIFNQDILRHDDRIKLFIVGGNSNSNYVQLLKKTILSNNIIFIPPVDNKVAQKYINACDFCLLPVKQNRVSPGSPIKLYDYISCGKPVITQKNLIGYSDEVENYNLGYTVNFYDAISTSQDILFLNPNQDFFLENNRYYAVNKLNWENRINDWLYFIENDL